MQYDIGVLGLGVMGKSLARNLANNNLKVAVYNIPFPGEETVTEQFVINFPDNNFYGAKNVNAFVESLAGPKVVLLMIKSGEPVDEMIEQLKPLLSEGDLIIDAGNSFYKDTRRRAIALEKEGLNFVGMGVSGGEEGALKGPSIMPAGTDLSKDRLLPMLEKIAASTNGEPCVRWIGKDGAGHFVKMVHNGIEYADMQMITETYELCRKTLQLTNTEIADLFESWMDGFHNSYLLEISIDILRKREGNEYVLDQILDVAGHKGTGMWTSREALELGVAVPSITAAMNQRIISSFKQNRVDFSEYAQTSALLDNKEIILDILGSGLLAGRLQAMAEGFHLMQVASNNYGWNLDMESIAAVWRGGCIIRSAMLPLVMDSYTKNPDMNHLYYADEYLDLLNRSMQDLDIVLAFAQTTGIALPCLTAANQYYKSFTTENLPINMIQAQRDYFGAHTYRTIEDPSTPKHTLWTKH